ncbi:hypothetical protein INT44_002749 [Umbelopsis vinacea]|uniref:Yeast cell wall synthesis Kre9/Knh1-like N-terminal domain-containing protein n=1 Tax=Umbelopsis vinacea TaxID=44442 RepID=A0A8H7Q5V1_9FUNG|nr:hypothetical protein INT44_002749 [Umbelopsis vinacea]
MHLSMLNSFHCSKRYLRVIIVSNKSGATITAGVSFQLEWEPDGSSAFNNDGAMDILLVSGVSASKVVAVLDSNVPPLGLDKSATVPLNIANGAYYIQLKVTRGNEMTAVNGPFSITSTSQSSISSQTSRTMIAV